MIAKTLAANVTIVLAAFAVNAQEMDWRSALADCARVDDPQTRVRCFEDLGRLATEPATDAPVSGRVDAAGTPAASGAMTVAGTMAGEAQTATAAHAPVADPATGDGDAPRRMRVVSCEQDASRRWYFQMENGEIWKQSNNERLRFRDCQFDVTVSKDFFGFSMSIESEGKDLRVFKLR